MQRIFSHHIIYCGRHYLNHVAQLDDHSTIPSFYPFKNEFHSTRFYSGTVSLTVVDGHLVVKQLSAEALPISL